MLLVREPVCFLSPSRSGQRIGPASRERGNRDSDMDRFSNYISTQDSMSYRVPWYGSGVAKTHTEQTGYTKHVYPDRRGFVFEINLKKTTCMRQSEAPNIATATHRDYRLSF